MTPTRWDHISGQWLHRLGVAGAGHLPDGIPMTVGRLVQITVTTQPTITRVPVRLEEKRYVEHLRYQTDRRLPPREMTPWPRRLAPALPTRRSSSGDRSIPRTRKSPRPSVIGGPSSWPPRRRSAIRSERCPGRCGTWRSRPSRNKLVATIHAGRGADCVHYFATMMSCESVWSCRSVGRLERQQMAGTVSWSAPGRAAANAKGGRRHSQWPAQRFPAGRELAPPAFIESPPGKSLTSLSY